MNAFGDEAVEVTNAGGNSPFVLVCDHASHFIPVAYGDMGLSAAERLSHIAWDPGALAVSRVREIVEQELCAAGDRHTGSGYAVPAEASVAA